MDRVWKVQWGYRLTPPGSTFSGSSHAGPSALFRSVSDASLPAACSWRFHTTFLTTLNIFLNLLWGCGNSFRCVSTFSDWESGRKTKKKNLNKQIQPANWLVNRLMAAELSVALINKRLSYNQAGPRKQTVPHAQFPVQLLLFTRGEYGRLMACFPDEIDSLQWCSSRMPEAS